jgi:RES domain-containing protein
MALSAYLQRWSGDAYRHIPAGSRYDVLDVRFAGRGADNRWNEPGQPTLYLAGDEGVLIAEWGRHFAIDRAPELERKTVERSVYRLTLSLDAVLDLRMTAVWHELSLERAPYCFLEFPVARATANFVRVTTEVQGILVPSVGFLDKLDRWCLVLFLEKLPALEHFVAAVTPCGPLRRGQRRPAGQFLPPL